MRFFNPFELILGWLRAGYPGWVPAGDYVPLVAVLQRRLTDDEIHRIGEELSARGPRLPDRFDVAAGVMRITDEVPTRDEIHRVCLRLTEAGWPVRQDPSS